MRVDALVDSGPLRRELTSLPNDFRGKGLVRAPAVDRPGEQPGLGPHPTPVLAQGFEPLRAEGNESVPAAFAVPDVDQHRSAVDVFDLQFFAIRDCACRWSKEPSAGCGGRDSGWRR